MVAESTVFCRLKFDAVVWLLLVRGTAVGGPEQQQEQLSHRPLIYQGRHADKGERQEQQRIQQHGKEN